MCAFYYVLNSPLVESAQIQGNIVRLDHVQVMPLGINCTKGEEECQASYLCDQIS